MVAPNNLQTEMEILAEKIETFEHLLHDSPSEAGSFPSYLARKLDEYRHRYEKLNHDYAEFFEAPQTA